MLEPFSSLAEFFVSSVFVRSYSLFIAFIFASALVYFMVLRGSLSRSLKSGIAAVDDVQSPEELAERLDSTSDRLEANEILGRPWIHLRQAMLPVEPGLPLRTTRDVGDFFHPLAVIDKHLSLRLFNSTPHILTGLGILGTFIGLAAGIANAQVGLSQANFNQMQDSLQDLLSGASLAFITSVVGMFLSLVFLFVERVSIRHLTSKLQGFTGNLERLVVRVTPELILSQQLTELEEQSNELKRFNTDLAFQIAAALDEKIAGRLTPTLELLITSVQDLGEQQRSAGDETLRALVGEFREAMTGSTNSEFERIATTLQRVDAALTKTVDELGAKEASLQQSMIELLEQIGAATATNSERLQSDIETNVNKLLDAFSISITELQSSIAQGRQDARDAIGVASSHAVEVMRDALGQSTSELSGAARLVATEIGDAGQELSSKIRRSSEEIGDQLQGLNGQVAAASELIDVIRAAASDLSVATASTKATVTQFAELESVLRSAAEQIARGSRSTEIGVHVIEKAAGSVNESLQILSEGQRTIVNAWSEYRGRFEGLDMALKGSFDALDAGVERYTDQVTTFHTNFDNHLGKAVESLGGAIKELEEVVDELVEWRENQ